MYFTGKTSDYCIALDSKARLVLPLEIRDALGIPKKGKILFSVSAAGRGAFLVEIRKASGSPADYVPFSKNGKQKL